MSVNTTPWRWPEPRELEEPAAGKPRVDVTLYHKGPIARPVAGYESWTTEDGRWQLVKYSDAAEWLGFTIGSNWHGVRGKRERWPMPRFEARTLEEVIRKLTEAYNVRFTLDTHQRYRGASYDLVEAQRMRRRQRAQMTPREAGEHLVIFRTPSEIEPWYYCDNCGYDASGVEFDRRGGFDKCPQCGDPGPMVPKGCNWEVVCSNAECDQTGCNLADCCASAAAGSCPMCGSPATVRPIQNERLRTRSLVLPTRRVAVGSAPRSALHFEMPW